MPFRIVATTIFFTDQCASGAMTWPKEEGLIAAEGPFQLCR